MIDKEKADKLRAAAGILADLEGYAEYADVLKASAENLDPPAPTWPDGTIAWITFRDGQRWLAVCRGKGWLVGGYDLAVSKNIIKVEPLRVLADDEIAVPRHLQSEMQRCLDEHQNCALCRVILQEHIDAGDRP